MASIETNISVGSKQAEVYKEFKATSVNEQPLPMGDGTIRISPFDDYFLFTLYEDTSGEDTPIDLSNVGVINISFIGENTEIKIPYYTNVKELDLSQGQVIFRISAEESKKILKLDNDNFYISSQGVSPEGDASDESVLYTGKFLTLTDDARQSLTSQIEALTKKYTEEVAKLRTEASLLKTERSDLAQQVAEQDVTIAALKASNLEMSNTISSLTTENESQDSTIGTVQNNAREAQKRAQNAQNKAGQTSAVQNKQKGKKDKATVAVAAAALQRTTI
jgi:hypothetical protein